MNTDCIAAKGIAALVTTIFLLISSPAIQADELRKAELISIETLDAGLHSNRILVSVGQRVERLLVTPNHDLNDLRIVNTDGSYLEQISTAYVGIVESLPNSWVRIVIDGDYIAGTIHAGGTSTHFTSALETALPADRRKLLAPITPPAAGLTDNGTRRGVLSLDESYEVVSVPVSERLTQTIGDVTRAVRIGVVVDSLYQEAIGGRGLSKAISIINSVDGLYREKFGLALKVDVVVLVTEDSDLTLDGPRLEDNLDLFRQYRIDSELLPDDLGLVHLFTGIESGDDAIGLAFKGAACRTDGYDVSMSRPFLYPELLTAHELGHNLGADHDDSTVDCRNVEDNLMFSAINGTTTREFSSCSADAINTRISQSTCYTAVIDIDLEVTQLESNQIRMSITNMDATRTIPSATLSLDLENASVAEAPEQCVLEEPTKLTCIIPATFAGDTQDVAVKLRFVPDLERTVTMRLEPTGFFDINNNNNFAELIIPGDPLPLAVTDGELVTTPQGGSQSGTGGSGGGTTDSGGGGAFGLPLLPVLLLNLCLSFRLKKRR